MLAYAAAVDLARCVLKGHLSNCSVMSLWAVITGNLQAYECSQGNLS